MIDFSSPSEAWDDFVLRTFKTEEELADGNLRSIFFCGMSAALPLVGLALTRPGLNKAQIEGLEALAREILKLIGEAIRLRREGMN